MYYVCIWHVLEYYLSLGRLQVYADGPAYETSVSGDGSIVPALNCNQLSAFIAEIITPLVQTSTLPARVRLSGGRTEDAVAEAAAGEEVRGTRRSSRARGRPGRVRLTPRLRGAASRC